MDLLEGLDYSVLMKNKARWKKEFLAKGDLQEIRIAVLCGSTFGVAQDFLELFLLFYGIKPNFLIGGYNRFYEEAVFENIALKNFDPDVILFYVTNKNLLISQDYTLDETVQQLSEKEVLRWNQIWDAVSKKYRCFIIQNNFELFQYRMIGNKSRTSETGILRYVDDINNHINKSVEINQHLYLDDINYLSAREGLLKWYDDKYWRLYKYAISMNSLPLYALNTANIIKAVLGINKKAIAIDLDNTLWGGIIGDVGVEGIQQGIDTPQGQAYSQFQRYLKYLSRQGILLNICSKNEFEIANKGLRSKSCVLKEQDFVQMKVNWENKPQNVENLAREINIMQDSFVFIDDNILECNAVRALCPGILTIQAKTPLHTMDELELFSPFEGTGSSKEDFQRLQLYQSEIKRTTTRTEYSCYEEYLSSLQTKCTIEMLNDCNVERVVQLLNKTNQFNFLSNRYTIQQFKALNNNANVHTIVARLSDKFGDLGIISILTLIIVDNTAIIHDWVMSCRVLERKVENVMLCKALRMCQEQQVEIMFGIYKPTEKNKKIENIFSDFGFYRCSYNETEKIWLSMKEFCLGIQDAIIWKCDAINETIIRNETLLISVED